MKNIQNTVIFGLLVSVLMLASCPVPTDTEEDPSALGDVPPLVDELSYNYALLRYHYLYANNELRPYSGYQGRGKNIPYGDVLAMYADVSDRWTRYWPPTDAVLVNAQLESSGDEQQLVGMSLVVYSANNAENPDELCVSRVWIGSPAEKSGLIEAGDRIIEINGVDLTALPLKGNDLILQYQAAAQSSTIALTLYRNNPSGGGTTITVPPITKQTMLPPTVYLDYIDAIPVIQITGFSGKSGYDEYAVNKKSSTINELRATLARVNERSPPVGIIDLRGNPGGEVGQCFGVIDELVAQGIYIQFEDHYWDGEAAVVDWYYAKASPGGLGEGIHWIFLADANSASAAEILLFAVKNHRPETYIVGEKTYGKGVGQYYMDTPSEGLASITALKFYDEYLQTWHGKGIKPDKAVPSAAALGEAFFYALSLSQPDSRSVLGAQVDSAAIRALNSLLMERQVPSNGIRGGAWKLLPPPAIPNFLTTGPDGQ
ncbi:hypothetical protein AGMMS50267_11430 [Spirochaetia bacterium]|nr:hypothetical protein AGMMS50267_11430 [Spirochaetia bacterium]